MRYLIYEPDAIESVNHDLARIVKKGTAPWRRCPTEESAAQVVRSRYPDAMPGPYETADDGKRTPVLIVWETARDLAAGLPPVLVVEPESEVAADEKVLKRYRKGDRASAPFSQAVWTRGVVPEPAIVHAEREAKARFTGFIGEIDTKMRVGQTKDGRSGLWFEVAGHGPFSVAAPVGTSLHLVDGNVGAPFPPGRQIDQGDVLPLELDDGTRYTCTAIAGGARSTHGMPNDLVLRKTTSDGPGTDSVETNARYKLDVETVVPATLDGPELAEIEPPYHQLFRRRELRANEDYTRRYHSAEDDDTMILLTAAEADYKARGLSFNQYMGRERASGSQLLDWYANGDMPEARPGVVAVFHPQFHKRDWEKTADTLTAMAKALERWIWVCECEESRWIMAMVGDPPPGDREDADGHAAWERHVRVSDQYIAVISPAGEWKMLGCS